MHWLPPDRTGFSLAIFLPELHLGASAPLHTLLTSMLRRICLTLAALQLLLVPITARVLTAHVSETGEDLLNFDGLLLVLGDVHAAPEQHVSSSGANLTYKAFDGTGSSDA